MKYLDEFRNRRLALKLSAKIKAISPKGKVNLMEVCGTHTQAFRRFGLAKLLPANIRLISGPGCPVCVTPEDYLDAAIRLTQDKEVILVTFGDMLRIPGSKSNLEKEKTRAGNIRLAYSSLESLNIARSNPGKKVVFLAVGFETTSPAIALSILMASKEKIRNLFFLSSLKLIPPAMEYLLRDKRLSLDGFLCPGHVSAIIGSHPYEFIPRKYGVACCISGFEPLDMLEGIYLLLSQIVRKEPKVENQYCRLVSREGNLKALRLMQEVFCVSAGSWRGLGVIPKSGLKIRKELLRFDAERMFGISYSQKTGRKNQKNCRCIEVLKGLISPLECPAFAKSCNPAHPLGPCMVSYEGACNAYYKYR